MTKVESFPAWRLRRLNAEQRAAYDQLRWRTIGPAERARLKKTLGWKRTRAETLALALELRAAGRGDLAIADELGVGARYLQRLLEQVRDPEKTPRNPCIHAADLALSCDAKVVVPPALAGRQMYAGDPFSYDLQTALRGAA